MQMEFGGFKYNESDRTLSVHEKQTGISLGRVPEILKVKGQRNITFHFDCRTDKYLRYISLFEQQEYRVKILL